MLPSDLKDRVVTAWTDLFGGLRAIDFKKDYREFLAAIDPAKAAIVELQIAIASFPTLNELEKKDLAEVLTAVDYLLTLRTPVMGQLAIAGLRLVLIWCEDEDK